MHVNFMTFDQTWAAKDVVSTLWKFKPVRCFKTNITGRFYTPGDRTASLGLRDDGTIGLLQNDTSYRSIWQISMSNRVF